MPKNTDFLQKNSDISKTMLGLVPQGIVSKTTYECVLTCQISGFQLVLTSFRHGEGSNFPDPPPTTPKSEPLKRPPRLRLIINRLFNYNNQCIMYLLLSRVRDLKCIG